VAGLADALAAWMRATGLGEVARLLPDGRLIVLPHAVHAANYTAPAEFARAVRSFLADG
jgi:pimeloyl-ACP methyl ester carboxylesterase